MTQFRKWLLLSLTLVFALPSMGIAVGKISIIVSVIPQKYFVKRIGGDYVSVLEMVQPGASPATYEPKPRQMIELSRARLYFAIGVPFENVWLGRIAAANPDLKIVHTDQGIQKMAMAERHHDEEDENGEESADHDHSGLDPHIWLSPPLVKIQAKTIMEALVENDPDHASEYRSNFQQFSDDLNQLDMEIQALFRDQKGSKFMVFHPSWGYFAEAYGLRQIAIEVEGKDPKPAVLQELIQHAREEGIRVIFAQPQFSVKSAKLISRSIQGEVIFADPLAEDWLSNLKSVAEKFQRAAK